MGPQPLTKQIDTGDVARREPTVDQDMFRPHPGTCFTTSVGVPHG